MLVCEGAWPTLIGVSCVIDFHPGLIWWVHLQDAGSLFSFHPQQPVFIDILISVPDVTFIEYIPLTTIASYRILSWCWDILGLRECNMWYHVDNHVDCSLSVWDLEEMSQSMTKSEGCTWCHKVITSRSSTHVRKILQAAFIFIWVQISESNMKHLCCQIPRACSKLPHRQETCSVAPLSYQLPKDHKGLCREKNLGWARDSMSPRVNPMKNPMDTMDIGYTC